MARGRKPTWDYERIADAYNSWYGDFESVVDAAEVRAIISKKESLFRRLVLHERPQEALLHLKLVLEGRMTEEEVLDRLRRYPADVPLLGTFQPDPDYAPRLPTWFSRLVRAWLEKRERTRVNPPPPEAWVGADNSESISLSLYLMADCLRDERFVWAMARVKAMWRMGEHDATTWFQWLYDQQEDSIKRLFPRGTPSPESLRVCESYGRGGGWTKPLDGRDVRGELAHGPYGLPLQDYKSHLKQLVRLAGGDPSEDTWQDWAEQLLWDLSRRKTMLQSPDGTYRTRWLRRERISPAWHWQERDIPFAPRTGPYVSTAWTNGNLQMTIRFPSRVVSLTHFPDGLRHALLDHITSLWGLYRTPLTSEQRISYLRRLSRASLTDQKDGKVLEKLWEGHEAELMKMSIAEQEREERLTVRRSRDQRRKAGQRASRRLQG